MGGISTLAPTAVPCPHVLGRWLLRTAKSSVTRADGTERPTELRGGRLVRTGAGCVFKPGHRGEHRTEDGRAWT
jgi:hypothetical protein